MWGGKRWKDDFKSQWKRSHYSDQTIHKEWCRGGEEGNQGAKESVAMKMMKSKRWIMKVIRENSSITVHGTSDDSPLESYTHSFISSLSFSPMISWDHHHLKENLITGTGKRGPQNNIFLREQSVFSSLFSSTIQKGPLHHITSPSPLQLLPPHVSFDSLFVRIVSLLFVIIPISIHFSSIISSRSGRRGWRWSWMFIRC